MISSSTHNKHLVLFNVCCQLQVILWRDTGFDQCRSTSTSVRDVVRRSKYQCLSTNRKISTSDSACCDCGTLGWLGDGPRSGSQVGKHTCACGPERSSGNPDLKTKPGFKTRIPQVPDALLLDLAKHETKIFLPDVGIEPTTTRLKAERSTAELTGRRPDHRTNCKRTCRYIVAVT